MRATPSLPFTSGLLRRGQDLSLVQQLSVVLNKQYYTLSHALPQPSVTLLSYRPRDVPERDHLTSNGELQTLKAFRGDLPQRRGGCYGCLERVTKV